MEKLVTTVTILNRIYNICFNYLKSPWDKASQSNFLVYKIREGRSNQKYHCILRDTNRDTNEEVLVRFYGNHFVQHDNYPYREAEVLVTYIMANHNFGPKILAVFEGGRIEEFIKGSQLSTKLYSSKEAFEILARKLSCLHRMDIPIKRTHNIMDMLKYKLEMYINNQSLNDYRNQLKSNEFSNQLLEFDYKDEINFIGKCSEHLEKTAVFSHNDLNPSNILNTNTVSDELVFNKLLIIDYEHSGYGYRWTDICIYFCEIAIYKSKKANKFSPHHYPNSKQRRYFILNYLGKHEDNSEDDSDVKQMELEISIGSLIVNIAQILWRLAHPDIGNREPIDLWEEANDRFLLYQYLKKTFTEDHKFLFCKSE